MFMALVNVSFAFFVVIEQFQRCSCFCFFQFEPDLVLVSAGFDSARGDPKVEHPSNHYTIIIVFASHCQHFAV